MSKPMTLKQQWERAKRSLERKHRMKTLFPYVEEEYVDKLIARSLKMEREAWALYQQSDEL